MYNLQITLDRITKLTQNKGISINQMLKDANLSSTIVDNIKRNRIPSVDKIFDLANYFDVSTDYLLGRTKNPEINTTPYIEEIPRNVIKIPLENLAVSAGFGQELVDDFDNVENEYIEIDADDFPKVDRAFRVQGDSMEPKYHNDDIVLVKCQPTLENGEIGIFTLNEKGYIKKFHIDDKGNRTLVSLNTDYLPIPVNSNDDVRIVGKVLCTL